MGRIKGCANEACEAHKKKLTYKETEMYCSKCGRELKYICKECYTPLSNSTKKYCLRCLAKHEDQKNKAKIVVGGIGGTLAAVVVAVLPGGKKILEIAKNIRR